MGGPNTIRSNHSPCTYRHYFPTCMHRLATIEIPKLITSLPAQVDEQVQMRSNRYKANFSFLKSPNPILKCRIDTPLLLGLVRPRRVSKRLGCQWLTMVDNG